MRLFLLFPIEGMLPIGSMFSGGMFILFLFMMIPVSAIGAITLLGILLIRRIGFSKEQRKKMEEETQRLREIHANLEKMQERLAVLETIMLDAPPTPANQLESENE